MQELVLDPENAAVAAERDLGIVDLAALMGGGEEVLPAVLDPFHRPVELHRRPRQHHLFRIEHHDLRAEAAADERRDHAHLPLAQAQHAGKAVANEDRRLGGVPHGELVGPAVPAGDDPARLHRDGCPVLVVEAAPDHMVGKCCGRPIVALALADPGGDVAADIVVHAR